MSQTGTVTIYDREHNIYISRNFSYDGVSQTVNYNFTTDSRESASIREGKTFRSKAKWDDHVLRMTTVRDNVTERERYSLESDGTLMLVVERPGHPPLTLHFQQKPAAFGIPRARLFSCGPTEQRLRQLNGSAACAPNQAAHPKCPRAVTYLMAVNAQGLF